MASKEMIDADHQEIIFPLSGTQATGYAPACRQIVGVLKQIMEEMQDKSCRGGCNCVTEERLGEVAAVHGLGG